MLKFLSFTVIIYHLTVCTVFASLKKVTVALEWFLNPHHALFIIGIEKGFFKEAGLEVKLLNVGGSMEGCKQVACKNIDFALPSEPQWIMQVSKNNLDLEPICTIIPHTLEVIISKYPLNELKNKRIGHASSGMGFSIAVLQEVLERQSLTLHDVTLIYTRQALLSSFMSGQVDAIMNVYQTYEVIDLQQYQKDYYIYSFKDFDIPSFASMILVTHKRYDKEISLKMQQALEKSCQYFQSTPLEESWKLFKSYAPDQATDINYKAWKQLVSIFKISPVNDDNDQAMNLRNFLKKYNLI